MIANKGFIDSIATTKKYNEDNTDLKPSNIQISKIMKNQLYMRFKKIAKGPLFLNSV